MKKYILLFVMFAPLFVFGQTKEQKQKIISKTNVTVLQKLAKKSEKKFKENKAKALKMAKEKGWQIKGEKDGRFFSLMKVTKDGTPIYYVTDNVNAAISTRANTLHNGGSLGLNIEGQGMTGYIWDGGHGRVTHQEYDGVSFNRLTIMDPSDPDAGLHFHAAHVTGTVIASGFEAEAKGMAPQALGIGYEWNNDDSEATTAAAGGMLLSNHSYGYGADQIPDQWFGAYTSDGVNWDNIMYNAPYYLMVVSAGNDGEDNTSNGVPLDGNSLYDKLNGNKTAKNNLVVANGQDANIDAAGNLISVSINSGSSEGPTDDYRIKPDITGNGTGLYSTYETADDAYNSISGTSMASPNVMGTLLILQQHYNNINASFMRAATLKGLALHTADDAGIDGPDAIFGWGLLNAKVAAQTITNNGNETIISELTLNDGGSYTLDVESDGLTDLVVSISWTDPAGTANGGTNSSTPALVNDLDVRVTQGVSTFYPYRLTSITTNSNAGDNIVDPYEKIIIPAASGTYTITVTHKGTLASSQDYSLIVTGRAGTLTAPVADFVADDLSPVVTTKTVSFFDLTDKLPTSWAWTFSPATVTYVNGTSATSQNPELRFNATGLYTVTLVATNAQGSDSEVKTDYINVTATCSNCYSYGNTSYNTSTTRVIFNTIDNTSAKPTDGNGNAYSDYTATSTTVTATNSYDLTVQVNTDGNYLVASKVWIDWNQDCDFDDSGEEYDLGTASNVTNGPTSNSPLSVTVPATALAGNTLMRVSTKFEPDGAVSSCETDFDGEVEEYTINVINPCPAPSDLSAINITTTSADLGWTNNGAATNWDIEWGTTPYTFTGTPDEDDVTANLFTLSGLTSSTSYEFYVRADCGADNTDVSEWSGPYNFTTLPDPPSISSIIPDNFYADFGKQLSISGSNFNGLSSVVLGGVTGSVVSNDGSTIVVDFPAGNYSDNTLVVTNVTGTDNYTCTVNTRDIIPVGNGTNTHSTITSALDGLFAWWGTTAFDADKIIDVYSDTYAETVTPNVSLNPTAVNMLVIQAHTDDTPVINATGNANGVYIGALDYVKVEGFTVYGATNDNIYTEGDYNQISFNRCYGSTAGSGIRLSASANSTVINNLLYSNYNYGLHLTGSDNLTVKNNTTYDNGHNVVNLLDQQIYLFDVESGDYAGWTTTGTTPNIWSVYNDVNFANSPTTSFMCNQTTSTLIYSSVDITDYDNLTISAYVRSYAPFPANMNNQDDLYGEYSFDNSNWVGFFHIQNDNPTYSQYSLASISTSGGTETTLFIRFRGICGTSEYWFVDDIEVRGDETGPEGIDGAGLYVESGTTISLENNIFVAKTGTDYLALKTESGTTITTDYNNYYKDAGNTNLVNYLGVDYTDFSTWANEGANDLESDPVFVNDGTDFHLQSTFGSFQGGQWPPISAIAGTWTNDASLSPAIDAGNADAYDNEPAVNGDVINLGCYGNTQQASKSDASGGTPGLWTGATSTNWVVSGNWDDGNVPIESTNVVITDVATNYDPIIGDKAVCNNLTIDDAGSVLTIDATGNLIVSGTLTNNSGTSGLIINSTESGDGSLIYNNAGIDATVQRFLDAPPSDTQWHFLSSPITAAPVSLFGIYNFYDYDESTDDWWTNATLYGTSGWNIPTGNLIPLNGYIYNISETTINFEGELNFNGGDYDATITYTEHTGDAANGDPYAIFDGWNLVSNPYPSELDWDAMTKTNVDATIYYYDDLAHNYAYYIDGAGSVNGGSRYIPSMQGFFVKASSSGGGTLTIPLSARVHTGQSFFKQTKNSVENLIRLSVSDKEYKDEILITLNNEATLLFDNKLDAYKRFSWDDEIPQIFSLSSEKKTSYAINSLPLSAGQHIIPIGFRYKNNGTYILNVTEFNFESYYVFFEDTYTNESINLRDIKEINIDYDDNSKVDRYQLNLLKNNPPVLGADIPDQEVELGTNYEYTISEDVFSDIDLNDKLSYIAKLSSGGSLPLWLSFNGQSLKFAGTPFKTQEIEILVVAKDLLGDIVSSSFVVTVSDTENPIIKSMPSNILQNTDMSSCNAAVTWIAPTATDNGSVTLTSSHESGATFDIGTTTVTYTATDASGNTASSSFDVTISDNENPVITNMPNDISQNIDISSGDAVVTWIPPTASDNCSVTLTSSHESGATFDIGTTTVTYTATDGSGNNVTSSFNVIVTNTTGLEITEDTESNICKVYPNPNNGMFIIEINSRYNVIHYEIISIAGNIIRKADIKNELTNQINIRDIANGTYILNLILDNDLVIKKSIVIEQ